MTKPTPPKAKRRIRTAEPAPTPKPRNKFPRFAKACDELPTSAQLFAWCLPVFSANGWTDPLPSGAIPDPKYWMHGYRMNRTQRVQRNSPLTQQVIAIPKGATPSDQDLERMMQDVSQKTATLFDNPDAMAAELDPLMPKDKEQQLALCRTIVYPSFCTRCIAMPYWFAHGKSPIHLLRKARHGDLSAFAQLLRMDKIGFMGDKFLRRLWIDTMLGQDAKARRQLLRGMAGAPSLQDFDMRQVKLRIVAVIHWAANEGGTKRVCSPADLLDLLHELARDRRQPNDPHFGDTNDATFGRLIRREQQALKKIFGGPPAANPADSKRKNTVKKAAKRTPR